MFGKIGYRIVKRRPIRTLASSLGIALAIALAMGGQTFVVNVQHAFMKYIEYRIGYTDIVGKTWPPSADIPLVSGILNYTPRLQIWLRCNFSGKVEWEYITGINETDLNYGAIEVIEGESNISAALMQGIVISERVARDLNVKVGEIITVRGYNMSSGEYRYASYTVISIVKNKGLVIDIGEGENYWAPSRIVLLNKTELFNLMCTKNYTHVYYHIDRSRYDHVERNLFKNSRWHFVSVSRILLDELTKYSNVASVLFNFLGGMAFLFAIILELNLTYMMVSENKRYFLALRAIGATRLQAIKMLLASVFCYDILAIPFAIPLTYFISILLSNTGVSSLLFEDRINVTPQLYTDILLNNSIILIGVSVIAAIVPAWRALSGEISQLKKGRTRLSWLFLIPGIFLVVLSHYEATVPAVEMLSNISSVEELTTPLLYLGLGVVGELTGLIIIVAAIFPALIYVLGLLAVRFPSAKVSIAHLKEERKRTMLVTGLVISGTAIYFLFANVLFSLKNSLVLSEKYAVGADISFYTYLTNDSLLNDLPVECLSTAQLAWGFGIPRTNASVMLYGINTTMPAWFPVELHGSLLPLIKGENQCIITERMAQMFNLRPGDILVLNYSSSENISLVINGTINVIPGAWQTVWSHAAERMYFAVLVSRNLTRLLKGDFTNFVLLKLNDPVTGAKLVEDMLEKKCINTWSFRVAQEEIEESIAPFRTVEQITNIMTGSFIVIAATGLFSIMVYSATTRKREIGILRALGFSSTQLVKIVILEAFEVMLVGIGVGILYGYPLSRYISENALSYTIFNRVTGMPIDGIAGFLILSMLLSLASAVYPAWISIKVEPARAMRENF